METEAKLSDPDRGRYGTDPVSASELLLCNHSVNREDWPGQRGSFRVSLSTFFIWIIVMESCFSDSTVYVTALILLLCLEYRMSESKVNMS